jgi:GNAT superfamily N-acetyltransferase
MARGLSGIIPGAELEKLINRRGPQWWDSAIRKGSRVSVLCFGDKIAGYANYGRNRARSLHFEGEIYELYLRPEFQGLGFGRRLFTSAKRDLGQSGLKSMVIWALSDNEPAVEFYRTLGGRMVARSSERFGGKSLDKVAFAGRPDLRLDGRRPGRLPFFSALILLDRFFGFRHRPDSLTSAYDRTTTRPVMRIDAISIGKIPDE